MRSWGVRAVWVLAALVPIATLAWSWSWRSDAPEPADLRASFGEAPLRLSWESCLDFEGEPNFLAFRLLHLGLLATPGGDFKRVALAAWGFALLAAVAIGWLLVRAQRAGGERPGAGAWTAFGVLLLALHAFSPAFGADFLLDARFRVFVPVTCFAAAVLVLTGAGSWRRRFVLAACLALGALFTERTGLLVWIALAPLVWSEARRQGRPRPWLELVTWCVLGNLGIAVCYDDPASLIARQGLVTQSLARPAELGSTLLQSAAWGLPDPFPDWELDGILLGGALLLALLVFVVGLVRGRRDAALVQRAMPWLGFAILGAGGVLLQGEDQFPPPHAASLMRELAWGRFALTLGVAGLWVVLAPRGARPAFRFLAPLALVLLLQEWSRGIHHAFTEQRYLRQGEALLAFSELRGLQLPPSRPPPIPTQGEIAELRARNRLRRAAPVTSDDVRALVQVGRDAGAAAGVLAALTPTGAQGVVQDHAGGAAPELVLLTRQRGGSERIFAIAAPDFVPGGSRFSWRAEALEPGTFADAEVVRAYGFELVPRRAMPLAGEFWYRDGRFVPLPEPAK